MPGAHVGAGRHRLDGVIPCDVLEHRRWTSRSGSRPGCWAASVALNCDFLFHPDEVSKSGFNPNDAVDFWDLVNRQDWEICKRVQQGLGTRVHEFGYYAPMEDMSLDIRRYVLERLGKEKG